MHWQAGIVAVALALAACGCQRPTQDSGWIDRQVVGEVMTHSELAANLRSLALAGGRVSGTPNAYRAEQFVVQRLRDYGLHDVHCEPFTMTSWLDRTTVVTVLDEPPSRLEGALSLGNCLSTPPEGITAELIDAGEGSATDFEKLGPAVQGRLALARENGSHRSAKMKLALEHGAVGMVLVAETPEHARVGRCHAEPRPEPGITVPGNAGQTLIQRLGAGEALWLNIKIEADAWDATPHNVVGEIPGRGPLAHEIVILSAHLDSWHLGEGAIDNGNGSAAILEAARALAAGGWQPRRTVRFLWFMGEEHGLLGSRAYVQAHDDELDDIVAVVNVDMPGSPRRLVHFGHPEVEPFLRSVRDALRGFEIAPEIGTSRGTWSDHAPFVEAGLCALCLPGDLGPGVQFYHTSGDKYDAVDIRATNQAAAALAVLVRHLADAPQRPCVRYEPTVLAPEIEHD